jgi:hypothetical protein
MKDPAWPPERSAGTPRSSAGSAASTNGLLERLLGDPRTRTRVYAVVAVGLFVLGMLAMGLRARRGARFNFAVGDGEGYFVYLPSLVIDHDLDFSNNVNVAELKSSGIPNFDSKTERGYLRNKYPIGFALSVSPAYLAADLLTWTGRALFPAKVAKPDGFGLAYQVLTFAMVAFFGLCAMILTDRVIMRSMQIDGRAVGIAVLLFWLGSHYLYYYARHPFMVHVVSGFWITCVVFLWVDLREKILKHQADKWRALAICFCFSMAVVCRNTDIFILPLFVYLFWLIIRAKMVSQYMRIIPLSLLGLAPVLLQMGIWHRMTGHWIVYSYGNERFYWGHPKLLQTLISSRHGLFSWTPLLILSFVGIFVYLRGKTSDGKPLVWGLLISFALLWYINSAWYDWWFGHAFGARAFLEISVLFIVGLAVYVDRVLRAGVWVKTFSLCFVALSLLITYGLLAVYETNRIDRDDYLFQFEKNRTAMLGSSRPPALSLR